MSMTRMPGRGGRSYNEDTRRLAMALIGVILIVFFLLVIRVALDKKDGKNPPLRPVRNRAEVIRTVLAK